MAIALIYKTRFQLTVSTSMCLLNKYFKIEITLQKYLIRVGSYTYRYNYSFQKFICTSKDIQDCTVPALSKCCIFLGSRT